MITGGDDDHTTALGRAGPGGRAGMVATFAGAFLDMGSDRVEVKISLPEGRDPTVLDWRIALSRKNRHRLRHSRVCKRNVPCLHDLLGYVRIWPFWEGDVEVADRQRREDVAEQTTTGAGCCVERT